MGVLSQDLRYAWRSLRKTPVFSLVAVTTLALGIGANTAIFSVVNAVLLRPLPFADPGRLVQLWQPLPGSPDPRNSMSYLDVADFRGMNHVFSGIASYRWGDFTLTADRQPLHIRGSVVSSELMPLLGSVPALGEILPPSGDRPGSRWVLLSDGLWKRRFGSDPRIVGRSLQLDGRPFTIAGVMPARFQFPIDPRPAEIWVGSGIDWERSPGSSDKAMAEQRGWRSLRALARLSPGVTIDRARAEIRSIARTLEKLYPDENAHRGAEIAPIHQTLVRELKPALVVLFGAVGCVLAIACANIANLLLAKGAARERELAVRAAIGASRSRMIRQLLTESVLLSAIGGAVGLLLGRWGIDLVVARGPRDLPRLAEVRLDPWVLAFTAALSLLTGIVFGLGPALRSSPDRLAESLKEGGRGASSGARRSRLRSSLIIAEVTLSLVLLAGAGLLLRSFARLQNVDPGFAPARVISLRLDLPDRSYPKLEQITRFFDDLQARGGAIPGIRSIAAVGPLPLGGGNMATSFEIEGRPIPRSELPETTVRLCTPGYFRTMGITMISGRDFTPEDRLASTPVAIVNATFARRFFPGKDAVGQRIKPGLAAVGEPPFRRIIAVVSDVKHQALSEPDEAESYLPLAQIPYGSMTLVARADGSLDEAARRITDAVHGIDPSLPLYAVRPMTEYLSQSVARPRFNTILLGLFAALALVLTAVGLYGVLSYSVAQRTHEIGIRRALGADAGDVYRLIVGDGMRLVALGLLLGIGGALLAARLLASLLFQTAPSDPATLAAVTATLAAVSLAASWLPARRAAGIEPTVALREE